MKKVKVSIGVIAYNEEKNIRNILKSLLNQKTNKVEIKEVIVVSSGSTDKTDNIVKQIARKNPKVKLIQEKERRGKASAINKFLKKAKSKIVIIESADTIPEKDTVEKLVLPVVEEKDTGMTGAHPLPVNKKTTIAGYMVHLLWRLHHEMALIKPKCGEMICFKKIIGSIPEDTGCDEAWIESEIVKRGYNLKYIPEAIVYNKGPETIREFIKQRRRIASAHFDLHKRMDYKVSSSDTNLLVKLLIKNIPFNPLEFSLYLFSIFIEIYSRFLGYIDYIKGKKHNIWEIIPSTKNLK